MRATRSGACRAFRSTAKRAGRPRRAGHVDVLVIDLPDVGRGLSYIYTMANCLRAARKHCIRVTSATGRNRSAARDRGPRSTRVRVVRRAVAIPCATG